jgi:hypothetical protein
VRIFIEMSIENYECLLRKVPEGSRVWTILKNGLIVSSSDAGVVRKIFYMVWDGADLKLVRHVAAKMCPKALPDIDKGLPFRRPRRNR